MPFKRDFNASIPFTSNLTGTIQVPATQLPAITKKYSKFIFELT